MDTGGGGGRAGGVMSRVGNDRGGELDRGEEAGGGEVRWESAGGGGAPRPLLTNAGLIRKFGLFIISLHKINLPNFDLHISDMTMG